MATRVRGLKEVSLNREYRQLDQDTTYSYEITDRDYLREAAEATDLSIERIQAHCRRSLWPLGTQAELPLGVG
jgi:hypothetical protein